MSVTPLQRGLVTGLLVFLGGWALLTTLTYFGNILIIFVTAGVIAFLLDYPVSFLEKWLARGWAGLVVYSSALFLLGILLVTLGPIALEQGQQLTERLPGLLRSAQQQAVGVSQWLASRGIRLNIEVLQEQVFAQISQRVQGFAESAIGLTVGTLGVALDGILIIVVAFYMILDGRKFWQGLLRFFPLALRDPLTNALSFNLRVFFIGQLVLGGFMTLALTPLFWILGSLFPLLSGLFIGLLELIPIIGATIGIAVVVSLTALQDPILALKLLAAAVVIQQIKDNILAPRILGNFTGLSPILIFGALLLGGKLGGLLGVILAIPLAGVAKAALDVLLPGDRLTEERLLP